jgi:hypothetical protein
VLTDRFQTAGTQVFQGNIVHVAVSAEGYRG